MSILVRDIKVRYTYKRTLSYSHTLITDTQYTRQHKNFWKLKLKMKEYKMYNSTYTLYFYCTRIHKSPSRKSDFS